MAAIFKALEEQNLSYCNPPASFEKCGQKIRLFDDMAVNKIGTCLDLSILYAACLEQAGLHPLVVMMEGHAFAGCWLVDDLFPLAVQDDFSLLGKKIEDGIGEIALVEATMLVETQRRPGAELQNNLFEQAMVIAAGKKEPPTALAE